MGERDNLANRSTQRDEGLQVQSEQSRPIPGWANGQWRAWDQLSGHELAGRHGEAKVEEGLMRLDLECRGFETFWARHNFIWAFLGGHNYYMGIFRRT